MTKDPRGFHQAFALGKEGCAGQQVNIGIENQHEHDDHATRGAHARQPQATAKPLAQQGLHGPGKIQQADEDEGQHIGRDREGQHQCPVQPAPTGEFAKAGKPGQADTQDCHADTDA
ncbi:hypothetical protein D3C71_1216890 [compost metagenome]